jgi:hypothetical protein
MGDTNQNLFMDLYSDPNTNNIDLNGLLSIQQNYLTYLKTQSQDKNSAPIIDNIQKNLTDTYNNYVNANETTDGLLTHQKEMSDIVDTERQRLIDKKESVDRILFGQKRAVGLNDGQRSRQKAYTYVIMVFIITLGAFILIYILSTFFPFVPQFVFDLASIIVFCAGAYFIGTTLVDINSRSKMNYDQLDLTAITSPVSGNILASSTTDNGTGDLRNLFSTPDFCYLGDCCGSGTMWDTKRKICVAGNSNVSGFTSINLSNLSNPKHNVSVNTPFEFDQYVPYK